MNDPEIRAVLMERLCQENASTGALVIPELALHQETTRIDVAVIAPDRFTGYEIKSEVDTLARLPSQMSSYNRVFGRMYLVAARNHLAEATALIPNWWGIIEAAPGVELIERRPARENPQVDPEALVQFLWKGECQDALKAAGKARGISKPRRNLWPMVAERYAVTQLKALVYENMRTRGTWTLQRTAGGPQSTGEEKTTP